MSIFILQWHLTNSCQQRCKHCYIYTDPAGSNTKVLSFEEIKTGIDNFVVFCSEYDLTPQINFTGGDPLLYPDFIKILEYTHSLKIDVHILGNPYLLNLKLANKLRNLGVTSYQMSLDGLKETHDMLRCKGSFDKTISAYKILRKAGIKSVCMFTLSQINKVDLIPLVEFIDGKVDVFDFARLVPFDKKQLNEQIDKKEFRCLLFNVLNIYRKKQGAQTKYGRKDHLWTLLYKELGLFHHVSPKLGVIYSGCSAGIRHMCIDVDGTILVCRRLPIKAGNIFDNFKLVFEQSKEMNALRNLDKYECKDCDLFGFCRGSPCISYGMNKDFYLKDPGCWK